MSGVGSVSGGSRQHNTTFLIAKPSVADRLPPPLRSVTSHLLELYHELWTMVAGRGFCKMRMVEWRSLPSHKRSSLLPLLLLLLNHASLDAQLAKRDKHVTEGGGRLGLRGGSTALIPAHTLYPQRKTSQTQLCRLPPATPPLQTLPLYRPQTSLPHHHS